MNAEEARLCLLLHSVTGLEDSTLARLLTSSGSPQALVAGGSSLWRELGLSAGVSRTLARALRKGSPTVNIDAQLEKLLAASEAAEQQQSQTAEAASAASAEAAESSRKAEIAEDALKVMLRQEIGQGLVDVQREEDKVIITVGSGGAFASGSAQLTADAVEIMNKIASSSSESKGMIKVSGHTDNVPLIFGSAYRDNWDLAAARSASVVQALQNTGVINGQRLEAISYGESRPLETNDTAAGRAKNRRIEIEINY